jgi:hypothetical protein
MEDGMDFSPQRNSHEHNRSSFESDGYEFTIVTPKQQSLNSRDNLKSKPKNTKPDQPPEKATPPGATNPSLGNNNKTAAPVPAPDHAAGATAAVTATSAGANTEQAAAAGNKETSGGARSNSIEESSSGGGGPVPSAATHVRRHTGGDSRWDTIQMASSRDAPLSLCHFRLLKRLGYGDIGSVYLVELRGTGAFFAMKVMDKASIISRNKMARAQTEREILGLLDHPFLPTLFTHFETDKFYCFVMEYCSGGNLHSLRQKQPGKHFTEPEARSTIISVVHHK